MLFDLLLKMSKKSTVEKVNDSDIQAIAQLFDGGNCRAVVPAARDIVYRRLCNAADRTEFIDRDASFLAKLDDALLHRVSYRHTQPP